MKITCIDFETANPFYGSVCAVGIAVTDGKEIIRRENILVKPHPKYSVFNRDNVRIHKITAEMVRDAQEFDAVYAGIKPLIDGCFVAAHNTVFDVAVLKEVLTVYNIPIPAFEHVCTCELSKAVFTEAPGHKLRAISEHLGYDFKHHDAGEDAAACANIIIRAMEKTGITDIRALAESAGVKTGRVEAGMPHLINEGLAKKASHNEHVKASHIKAATDRFDTAHPLYNKEVAFTGEFGNGTGRKQAMQMVADAGGKPVDRVTQATDILVACKGSYFRRRDARARESGKVIAAKKIVEAGGKIRIISEEEFFSLMHKV